MPPIKSIPTLKPSVPGQQSVRSQELEEKICQEVSRVMESDFISSPTPWLLDPCILCMAETAPYVGCWLKAYITF